MSKEIKEWVEAARERAAALFGGHSQVPYGTPEAVVLGTLSNGGGLYPIPGQVVTGENGVRYALRDGVEVAALAAEVIWEWHSQSDALLDDLYNDEEIKVIDEEIKVMNKARAERILKVQRRLNPPDSDW